MAKPKKRVVKFTGSSRGGDSPRVIELARRLDALDPEKLAFVRRLVLHHKQIMPLLASDVSEYARFKRLWDDGDLPALDQWLRSKTISIAR